MSDDQLEEKTKKSRNDNASRCKLRADKTFKRFLIANGFPKDELD